MYNLTMQYFPRRWALRKGREHTTSQICRGRNAEGLGSVQKLLKELCV